MTLNKVLESNSGLVSENNSHRHGAHGKKKKITVDIRALNNQDIPVSHKNCSRGDYICKTKVIAVL